MLDDKGCLYQSFFAFSLPSLFCLCLTGIHFLDAEASQARIFELSISGRIGMSEVRHNTVKLILVIKSSGNKPVEPYQSC